MRVVVIVGDVAGCQLSVALYDILAMFQNVLWTKPCRLQHCLDEINNAL